MSWEKDDCLVYLTLGDGDFTFSLDLAGWLFETTTYCCNDSESVTTGTSALQQRRKLVCTGLDSLTSLSSKYRDTPFLLKQLNRFHDSGDDTTLFSVIVRHEVNAIESSSSSSARHAIASHLPARIVMFNHPHLATENAKLHCQFLCHLFHAVSHSWMAASGIFLLTLAQGQYERWECEKAAQRHEMVLLQRSVFQSPPLLTGDKVTMKRSYYSLRRHQTGKSFAKRVLGASETFVFHRKQETIDPQWRKYVGWLSSEYTSPPATGGRNTQVEEQCQTYPCPHCDKVFSEKRSVQNHIRSKHGKRERETEFFCEICSQKDGQTRAFDSAQGLEDHINAKHRAVHTSIRPDWCRTSNERPAISIQSCPTCGAQLAGSDPSQVMKIHMESFLPLNERSDQKLSFPCSFCDKVFQQDRARLQHENCCSRKTVTVTEGY